MNIYNKNLLIITSFIGVCYISKKIFKKYIDYKTFSKIDEQFPRNKIWEQELQIYECSLPKIHINISKRKKCFLLIGGYRDIPLLWKEFEQILKNNNIDYYAPRTFGNGRSFFQDFDTKDWVITYLEAIYVLQELYEEVDIIGFSTGASIALYLSQFNYKIKINNLFLVSPFLLYNEENSTFFYFYKSKLSFILNNLYNLLFDYYPKTFVSDKDDHKLLTNNFNEDYGTLNFSNKLINFVQFRPQKINSKNLCIFYSNNDQIIGDIEKQYNIISKIYSKKTNLIEISNPHDVCTHSIFKFDYNINKEIFDKMMLFN
jgi:esterase/lipase